MSEMSDEEIRRVLLLGLVVLCFIGFIWPEPFRRLLSWRLKKAIEQATVVESPPPPTPEVEEPEPVAPPVKMRFLTAQEFEKMLRQCIKEGGEEVRVYLLCPDNGEGGPTGSFEENYREVFDKVAKELFAFKPQKKLTMSSFAFRIDTVFKPLVMGLPFAAGETYRRGDGFGECDHFSSVHVGLGYIELVVQPYWSRVHRFEFQGYEKLVNDYLCSYLKATTVLTKKIAVPAITKEVLQFLEGIQDVTNVQVYRSPGFLNLQIDAEKEVVLISDAGAFFHYTNDTQDVFKECLAVELDRLSGEGIEYQRRLLEPTGFHMKHTVQTPDRLVTRFTNPHLSIQEAKQ